MSDEQRATSEAAGAAVADTLLRVLIARGALRDGARTVIALAGESGSGKSTAALNLARALERAHQSAVVLHQDDYFVRPPATNYAHRVADIHSVGPAEVNFARLAEHVEAFRLGAHVPDAPRVDYAGNRFRTHTVDFASAAVLVVEGTYVLAHLSADVRVFLEATYLDTRARRRTRNRDVDSPFIEEVLAIEHVIVSAQRALADVVVDTSDAIVERQR